MSAERSGRVKDRLAGTGRDPEGIGWNADVICGDGDRCDGHRIVVMHGRHDLDTRFALLLLAFLAVLFLELLAYVALALTAVVAYGALLAQHPGDRGTLCRICREDDDGTRDADAQARHDQQGHDPGVYLMRYGEEGEHQRSNLRRSR